MSRQEITNNIKKHMYKEMKMFLVDSHDMSNVKAENILKCNDFYITKSAKKMYKDYKKDDELDELIQGGENDWYREYLESFFEVFDCEEDDEQNSRNESRRRS